MDIGSPYNPFSSHLLEPARGGYIFPPSHSLEQIIQSLEQHAWRGELTGKHGAGKSTLLSDICATLEKRGKRTVWWQSSDRQRLPPASWLSDIRRADVIACDGAERLLPGLLLFLRAITRLMGRGFIVTSHRKFGIGAVIPIKADPHLLAQKFDVNHVTELSPNQWLDKIKVDLERHDGNAREVLFDLYEEYENQYAQQINRTTSPAPAPPLH